MRKTRTFDSEAAGDWGDPWWPADAPVRARKRTPRAPAGSDLGVPLGYVLAFGAAVYGLAFLVQALADRIAVSSGFDLKSDGWRRFGTQNLIAASLAFLLMLVMVAALWVTLRKEKFPFQLYDVQEILDSPPLPPARTTERVMTINPAAARRQMTAVTQARQRSAFEQFVADLDTHGTSHDYWTSKTRGRLTRPQYLEYRQSLMAMGYAEWIGGDSHNGWTLTAPAGDVLAAIQDL